MSCAIDREADFRARLQQHWEASERGDLDAERAIYAADAILDYPQSGERDLWVSECVITYDGAPTCSLSVMEIADGLVTHETQYFADPFPASCGRAALAEPIPAREQPT